MSLQNMLILAGLLVILLVVAGFSVLYAKIYKFSPQEDTPAALGLKDVRVATFRSEDGTEVAAWVRPPVGDAPVVLYFMGNFTSIGPSVERMKPLFDTGIGFAALVYRGSGGAGGTPSEKTFAADARALYDNLDNIMGGEIPVARRFLHGYSLGTGVAVRLASERPVAGLVLEAAYSRLCEFFTDRLYGLPFCFIMYRERYDSLSRIAKVHAPLLMLHGEEDSSVRIARGRTLFAAAHEPKRFIAFKGGTHVNLVRIGLIEAEIDFLKEFAPGHWSEK